MKVDWIPVTEKLPGDSEDVLLTVWFPADGDDPIVLVGWMNTISGEWTVYDEEWPSAKYNVIAWAPLPEPCKRGEEK